MANEFLEIVTPEGVLVRVLPGYRPARVAVTATEEARHVLADLTTDQARQLAARLIEQADRSERHHLRLWLHRIEEECARKGATDHDVRIRNAALAALRGSDAPDCFGLPLEI